MEKRQEHGKLHGHPRSLWRGDRIRVREHWRNHMEKNMEQELETGATHGLIGRITYIVLLGHKAL